MRATTMIPMLVAWLATASCGSRAGLSDELLARGAGGGSPGSSGSNAASSSGSSSGSGYGGSGSSGGSSGWGGSSSGYGEPPPSSASSGGSACGPNLFDYGAMSFLGGCWSCVATGCMAELGACTQDCTCNEEIVKALACVNSGGNVLSCFMQAVTLGQNGGDPALEALIPCLIPAGGECNCTAGGGSSSGATSSSSSGGEDASGECTHNGGSSSTGNGQCSSTLAEVCGSKNYQVICSCPQGSCVCFGDTTTVVPFSHCPYCPGITSDEPGPTPEETFAACGFPY
jgi:hypothetical protein